MRHAAVLFAFLALPLAVQAAGPAPIRCGVEMRNVALRIADDVVLQVRTLDGEFVSRHRARPPIFDDPNSYSLRIKSAEMSLDGTSLTNLLHQALTAHPAPLRDVKVAIEGDHLHVTGKIQKGAPVPFSMDASVSVAPDGWLRLHATKLTAVGVPVKGLLDLFGLKMDDLMKLPPGSGIKADGDDLLMDTTAMLPPPRTEGRVQRVAMSGTRLTMVMAGPGAPPARPATLPLPAARNYLYFYGGTIRFGKLTMSNADMQLIDADPRDPFDFSPPHYEVQLVAGYSRNTARKGLQVYMPDYSDVVKHHRALPPPRIK
jgi:hypothetical protein